MITEQPVNDELTIYRYFTGKRFYEGDRNLLNKNKALPVHDLIYTRCC